ncbi:hypothetical protein [Gluconobacter albidus]|nr:hypothetical protein [Gluconobacter albidus]
MIQFIKKVWRFFQEPDAGHDENFDVQTNECTVVFDEGFNEWAQRTTW